MQNQNHFPEVKIEADSSCSEIFLTRPELICEIKTENIDNSVKIEEENSNKMIFYSANSFVKVEEAKVQYQSKRLTKKIPNTKQKKLKTIIIQKERSTSGVLIKKKCKDKRKGKYQQSLAQRFIKRITGYHYSKNFNQFYHKQMTMFMRQSQQNSMGEKNQNQIIWLIQQEKVINKEMSREEIQLLTEYMLASVMSYEPYMKKHKETKLFELFQGSEFEFFQFFFRSLFKKLYEIMIKVTYRRAIKEMLNKNLMTFPIKDISYNGLDQYGEIQIAQTFNIVFESSLMLWNNLQGRGELLKLKLEKFTEIY